jgi:hypothetical protein
MILYQLNYLLQRRLDQLGTAVWIKLGSYSNSEVAQAALPPATTTTPADDAGCALAHL